jgi:hypothetical protein
MNSIVNKIRWLAVFVVFVGAAACSDKVDPVNAATPKKPSAAKISLDVYKSRTCSCCEKWVTHVEASGFEAAVYHPNDLNKLKVDRGVSPRHQSCHTAVSKEGYVFEGHIPADIIHRFLADPPPNAIGLAVPGMPVGSPGMEVGNRQDQYDVLLLIRDGSDAVYQHMGDKH